MSTIPEASTQEVLAGLVERVTYHNAENGFCVLRARARGHRDVVTVVGHAASISAGEWITASGDWVNDRTHGQQFKARLAQRPADPRMQRLGQKQAGIPATKEQPPARPQNVVNLLDALRRSIQEEKRVPAPAKKGRKRVEGQREMLFPILGKRGKEAGEQASCPTSRAAEEGWMIGGPLPDPQGRSSGPDLKRRSASLDRRRS
jgi:hypothetical protein